MSNIIKSVQQFSKESITHRVTFMMIVGILTTCIMLGPIVQIPIVIIHNKTKS